MPKAQKCFFFTFFGKGEQAWFSDYAIQKTRLYSRPFLGKVRLVDPVNFEPKYRHPVAVG